jgi:hypothetical protein
MTAAYFEDHPTDPDKVILRKPRLDQGPDYERGFIDGMMYQTQTTVNKAVDAMSKRTWVGLTKEERHEISMANKPYVADIMAAHEEELKRRNT